jgi:NAD(P)-dependent dehydrogenase (short-subunit alcohol dehydrogenase family)
MVFAKSPCTEEAGITALLKGLRTQSQGFTTGGWNTMNQTMKDKTVIITGANRGIGKETARQVAQLGARVYLACRSIRHATIARDELAALTGNENIFARELDLSLIHSIHTFADSFKRYEERLDVLINNAGIMSRTKQLTAGGVELTFAVNVLGHHLLTQLLYDRIKNSDASRIINVASDYAGGLDVDDINFDRRPYDLTRAYKQSKQANRMMTRAWARRAEIDHVSVYSMTPGFIPGTDLFREQTPGNKFFLRTLALFIGRTVQQGADTVIWLATSDTVRGSNGGFFKERKEATCEFLNPETEMRLWDKCEEFLTHHRIFD